MNIPDIAGLTLGEAKNVLELSGMIIAKVTILSPPRDKSAEYEDSYRVIRLINIDTDKFEIQICKPL